MKAWLATIVVLLSSISASAYDFEVDGICYNVTSSTDLTVEVTYRGSRGRIFASGVPPGLPGIDFLNLQESNLLLLILLSFSCSSPFFFCKHM